MISQKKLNFYFLYFFKEYAFACYPPVQANTYSLTLAVKNYIFIFFQGSRSMVLVVLEDEVL